VNLIVPIGQMDLGFGKNQGFRKNIVSVMVACQTGPKSFCDSLDSYGRDTFIEAFELWDCGC